MYFLKKIYREKMHYSKEFYKTSGLYSLSNEGSCVFESPFEKSVTQKTNSTNSLIMVF